ncbi:MAG TPA: hypothetical protein DCM05_05955 [Elusimicrobia bacterium]|nr:hypothetical protein [Elusimicrobiota bacterium]
MKRQDFVLLALFALLALALLAPAGLVLGLVPAGYGDLLAYHHPLRHLAVSALQAGRLPGWNPYIFGGVPLLANPQATVFYPVSLLGLFFPMTLALSWDLLAHWIWAALGTHLLARRKKLSALSAFTLACAYALSPFLVYRVTMGIPTQLAALAWVPWAWLAMESGLSGLLALVWALQFLSGHPQFLVINALGMALWCGARAPRRLGALVLEGLGALALALMQWPLTWEFLAHSVRAAWPLDYSTAYSVGLPELKSWVSPGALGLPGGGFGGPPSVFFETASMYAGLAALALAAAGLWRGPKAPVLLLAAGLFLAAGGNNPVYVALLKKTALGLLRTPARFLLLCLLGLLLAAGAALKGLESRGRALRWSILAAVLLELVLWDRRFLGVEDARPYLTPKPHIVEAAAGAPLRVLTDPAHAAPDKTLLYRAMNVNGYEAFFLEAFPAWAAASEGKPAADASRSYLTRHDTPWMKKAGVAFKIDAGGRLLPAPSPWTLAAYADGEGGLSGRMQVALPRPERLLAIGVAPESASEIKVSVPFYPGWRARLGGRPVLLEQDGLFSKVRLPADAAPEATLELRLDFKPRRWALFALGAAAAWLALFGLLLRKPC